MSQPLPKSISFFALTMIAIGASIGSGIFASPSEVAKELITGQQVLLVWLIGGVVAMTGALTFGELAARYPGTGGVYLYIREAYGKLAAFLYGWSILTVITSGAIAGLAVIFSLYFCPIFGLPESAHLPVAILELIIVTLINVFGVKYSTGFSSMMTVIKMLGIALIIIVAFMYGNELPANFSMSQTSSGSLSFGVALIGVLWAYGGWHHASYVGGEVVNAQKILPKALITGAFAVTVLYVLVNLAYMSLLSLADMSTSAALAADAITKVTAVGGILVSILIAISTFGTSGIFMLSTPRIYYMMGSDKVFFGWLADLHPKYGTPMKAILFQSIIALILLLIWQTFKNLSAYVVFMDWIFMTMGAIALFLFRKRDGKSPGYKVPLYPIVPLIFIGISVWFLISTLIGRPEQAIAGLVLMVLGLPVYYFFVRNKREKG
jgi:APA family basic amino acid/polyamine antiporter